MPDNTPIEKMYQALLKEGKSEEAAAQIAQAKTGLSLKTGKPPKGKDEEMKNCGSSFQNDVYPETENMTREQLEEIVRKRKPPLNQKAASTLITKFGYSYAKITSLKGFHEDTSFQNGRTRALDHIMNKAERVGIKLENAWKDQKDGFGKGPSRTEKIKGLEDAMRGKRAFGYEYTPKGAEETLQNQFGYTDDMIRKVKFSNVGIKIRNEQGEQYDHQIIHKYGTIYIKKDGTCLAVPFNGTPEKKCRTEQEAIHYLTFQK